MTGNVIIDDVETEPSHSFRPPTGWIVGLAAVVVVTLVMLPGQSEPEPSTTTATVPEVVLPEDRWVPVELPGSGGLTDVTVTAGGDYLAVGDGPQFWHSEDGVAWEWADYGGEAGDRVSAVASLDSTGVAVGARLIDGLQPRAAAWVSDSGAEWERAPLDSPGASGLTGIEATNDTLVAWGWAGSSDPFSPDFAAVLAVSPDGHSWESVEPPVADIGIRSVVAHGNLWYLMGVHVGQPALWSSPDLRNWERIPTEGMPFGWAMADLARNGMVANLEELRTGMTRVWAQHEDGSWSPIGDRIVGGPAKMTGATADPVGVGSGTLWQLDQEDGWEPVDLEGEVMAVAGAVAVGSSSRGQPLAWLDSPDAEPVVRIGMAAGGFWELVADLGRGGLRGVWPVADGWVVGGEDRWWMVDSGGITPIDSAPSEFTHRVVPVGEEWVALPSLHWTSDGRTWTQRGEPWPGAEGSVAGVIAVAGVAGEVRAAGDFGGGYWATAVSGDRGETWELSIQAPQLPLWDFWPGLGGFVALSPGQSGATVVSSENGVDWTPVTTGRALFNTQAPGVITDDGSLLMLDQGEEVRPPRLDISALARRDDQIFVVAGNRLWIGPEQWEDIPLDPPHGMEGTELHPLPLGERLLAVAVDRGRTLLYEWGP